MPIRLPLATTTWDADERAAILEVLDAGMFTMGERVATFEAAFAQSVGSRYAVMSNSGSSANLLAVAALCLRSSQPLLPGDEVIVPAVSWATTYYPLSQYGLRLRFVDIDPETLNLDCGQLAAAITDRTRMVVAVNLLGNPNDFSRIRTILAGRAIELMEDNCEALGATFQNQAAGTFGVVGTYSCFFSHHISTMEGGLTVTDSEELYQLMLSLRAHGWTRPLPRENWVCGTLNDDPFEESFRFVLPGYNLRPLEMSGAIGICQLRKLPTLIAGRRKNAALFCERFRQHPWLDIQRETGESSWFGFSLLLRSDAPVTRATLQGALRDAGIDCRPIVAGNFLRHPVIRHLAHSVAGPVDAANRVHDHGLFVGNHHYDISAEIDYMYDVIQNLDARGDARD